MRTREPARWPERHRRASRRVRRRRAFVAGSALVLSGAAVLGALLLRGGGVERVCRPDELVSRGGVRLTPGAMAAFERAEADLGSPIDVVQSYRSCREQAAACERICGDRLGCPDRCAPPGYSWHQRGEAIDVTQETLDTPGAIAALEDAGWCQSLPATDPGHFSFDGCH